MVRIQAHSRLMVTPQRTADSLYSPTPMIAPVMVWVVLTGILRIFGDKQVVAPAVGTNTFQRGYFRNLGPHCSIIRHPPPWFRYRWRRNRLMEPSRAWCLPSRCPAAIIAVVMIPSITFCESFMCPRLNSPRIPIADA